MRNVKILSAEELRTKLKRLPRWFYDDGRIYRTFAFDRLADAAGFIADAAPYFGKKDNPDIYIVYNKVLFELTRYDIGCKITEGDLALAGRLEGLYGRRKKGRKKER